MFSATELQTILDREGVPVEARLSVELDVLKDGTPIAWIDGNYVSDYLLELTHIGAMSLYCRCSIQKCGDGKWMATEYGYDGRSWHGDTAFEALARACGAVAKEPQ